MGHEHPQVDPMTEHRALAALIANSRTQPSIVDDDYPEWAHIHDRLKYAYVRAVKAGSPQRFALEVR